MYALHYYKKYSSCELSTSRCDGFVVACGPGAGFEVARGVTGGSGVVTVTTLLFTVNIIQVCRRVGGVVILVAFSSLAALEVSTMKISSVAVGASMTLG